MMSRLILTCGLGLCLTTLSCSESETKGPAAAKGGPSASATIASVKLPATDADQPADYPGLHNVVAFADGLYSGSVPDGQAGFDTLAAMGIKTIISVDGATPDVTAANAHGLRYVHLPIGYNGMDRERTLEIARAIKDLPGPVYLHCHHGKHRSAGAMGAAAVTLGLSSPEQATARMKVSGTAPNYTGLYQCVAVATIASMDELASADNTFPEVLKTSGFVKTMVEIDEVFEHLKAIEKAGWIAPKDHPDLVPVAEAGRIADLLRNLQDNDRVKARPDEFRQMLMNGSRLAESLEGGLTKTGATTQELSARFKLINQSCKDCHAKYRD